jgi:hypothetical protein
MVGAYHLDDRLWQFTRALVGRHEDDIQRARGQRGEAAFTRSEQHGGNHRDLAQCQQRGVLEANDIGLGRVVHDEVL